MIYQNWENVFKYLLLRVDVVPCYVKKIIVEFEFDLGSVDLGSGLTNWCFDFLTLVSIENAISFASPTSRGSKLYNWRVGNLIYANAAAAICPAMTPSETDNPQKPGTRS